MWGTLHLNLEGGRIAGWLCDAWTEAGTPAPEVLLPRLYWLNKEDDRFHRVMLDIPFVGASTLNLGPIDSDLEPRREVFMRVTLARWEDEYFKTQGISVTPEVSNGG
jgi:hypothetical protein